MTQRFDYFSNRFDSPGEYELFLKDCERFQPHLNRCVPTDGLEEQMDEVFEEEKTLRFLIAPMGLGHIVECQVCYFPLRLDGKRTWALLQ